ncbi:MAG: response regulator, partial [Oxalobacteraceae bacterium]
DDQALRGHLHRLQASCGFVGAARLAGAVRLLRGDPHSSTAQTQFHAAVAALLH